MPVVFIEENGQGKLAIDGIKLLASLNVDIEVVTSEEICDKLLALSNEERIELFNSCLVEPASIYPFEEKSKEYYESIFSHKLLKEEYNPFKPMEPYFCRPPETIKKELKYEKNPMKKKQLNRELNDSIKYFKYGRIF